MDNDIRTKRDEKVDKVVFVTGAAQGLGYAIMLQHLSLGHLVFALDYKYSNELESIESKNKSLKFILCDIASTESVNRAVNCALEVASKVDILYNVAGIYRFNDKVGLSETDLDFGLTMFNVNTLGALRVTKAMLPLFKQNSAIINISSEAGSIGSCKRKEEYSYCMSKAALNMGAKILSNELEQHSIRVINIHPGWLKTQMGGPDAFKSDHAILPEASAKHIVDIALEIDILPRETLFIDYMLQKIEY